MNDDKIYQDVAALHHKVLLLEKALDGSNRRAEAFDREICLNKKHIGAILKLLQEEEDELG